MKQIKKKRPTSPRRIPSDYKNSHITPLWIAGCYYNPEDPRLFVPNFPPGNFLGRGLLGFPVVNFGHPRGWLMAGGMLMALGGVLLAVFLFTQSFWLIFPGVCFLLLNILVGGYVYLRILDR